jgi:hypothetical protein
VAGTAVCDDGIVIDLSVMRAVSVDPVERTALVQGGALWGDVDHETQAHRLAIAVASCYAGSVEDGERAVRALRHFGTPLVDLVGPTRYVDHQSGTDDTVPHGWHDSWKATNLAGLSDEVIDIVAEHAYDATSPRSYAMTRAASARPTATRTGGSPWYAVARGP